MFLTLYYEIRFIIVSKRASKRRLKAVVRSEKMSTSSREQNSVIG